MSGTDVLWAMALVLGAVLGLGLLVRHALRDARPGPDDRELDERGPQ